MHTFEVFESEKHLEGIARIWNEIIEEGESFPDETPMTEDEAREYFLSQTDTMCLIDSESGEIVGAYILHPNNVGRCAQIGNCSYGVSASCRGQGLGRRLVVHSIERAKMRGFKGLQFNAVVETNYSAIKLYLSLGFRIIGMLENGFRKPGNIYCNTLVFQKSF